MKAFANLGLQTLFLLARSSEPTASSNPTSSHYTIVAGAQARTVGKRFCGELITLMLELRLWNKPIGRDGAAPSDSPTPKIFADQNIFSKNQNADPLRIFPNQTRFQHSMRKQNI